MNKLFVLIIFLLPHNSHACLGQKLFVDLSKAIVSIEIEADNVTFRHVRALDFQTKMNVKIEVQKSEAIGGLFLYNLFRKSADGISGEIVATEKFTGKPIKVNLTLTPQKKGGCSKGKVTYK
jgi:hypothetical protein